MTLSPTGDPRPGRGQSCSTPCVVASILCGVVDEVVDWPATVAGMDRRWRATRDEQRRVIERLLHGGTMSTEFLRQQADLVEQRARADELQERVDVVLDRMVGKRGSPVAREVCRLLEEPPEPPAPYAV